MIEAVTCIDVFNNVCGQQFNDMLWICVLVILFDPEQMRIMGNALKILGEYDFFFKGPTR